MTFTWKGLVAGVLLAMLCTAIACWFLWCREPAAAPVSAATIAEAEAKGIETEPTKGKPVGVDLPKGTRAVDTITGSLPARRSAEEQDAAAERSTEGDPVKLIADSGLGCKPNPDLYAAITPADITVDCHAERVELGPGKFGVRLFGNASVRLPGDKKISRGCDPAAGEMCDDSGRAAMQIQEWKTAAETKVRRWDGELRVGVELRDVVYDPHVAGKIGGSWYPPKHRTGLAGEFVRDLTASRAHPPDWSVSVSAAIDVGP